MPYSNKLNSPGKIWARTHTYNQAFRKINSEVFRSSNHVVVASVDCGDILYLHHDGPLGLGVPLRNIVACDTDPTAREAAKALRATVSPRPDVEDTCNWQMSRRGRSGVATINVDLCGPIHTCLPIFKRILDRYSEVVPLISLTFVRARGLKNDDDEKRADLLSESLGGKYDYEYFSYKSEVEGKNLSTPMAVVAVVSSSSTKELERGLLAAY